MDSDRLWTVNEVCTFLQVSKSWVYQRTAAGELPHVRIGGLLRFVPDQIRALARDGKAASVSLLRRT